MQNGDARPGTSMRRPITGPAVLLGMGLGGLFDGIVLHQILQWHHMMTSQGDFPATTVRGLEVNTLADGLFHAIAYVFVTVGLFVLWDRARSGGVAWSWKALLGWMLVGWGSFNIVEGVIDHHILGIHHVRTGGNQLAWDLAFLALGVVLVVIGWTIAGPAHAGQTYGRSFSTSGNSGP
jgi:uncharacterized membrane protein